MNTIYRDMLSKKENGGVRHLVCRRNCFIKEGQRGNCSVYENRGGEIVSLGYGKVSSFAVDPIEKKPLYHFHPTSKVFSIGGVSCNFHCSGCQNHAISRFSQEKLDLARDISPEQAVDMAIMTGCKGIAFTYNEPTIYAEYTLDTFKLAKEKGLYTVYVTNGYMSRELIKLLTPVLDAASVDIKAFSRESMRKVSDAVNDYQGVLDSCINLKEGGVHLEIVTNLIPGLNTSLYELKDTAQWIKDNLGEQTPFHLTRYIPQEILPGVGATDNDFFAKVMEQNWQLGLKYTYVGNVPNHSAQNTFCGYCGHQLVGRYSGQATIKGLTLDGNCETCAHTTNFIL